MGRTKGRNSVKLVLKGVHSVLSNRCAFSVNEGLFLTLRKGFVKGVLMDYTGARIMGIRSVRRVTCLPAGGVKRIKRLRSPIVCLVTRIT